MYYYIFRLLFLILLLSSCDSNLPVPSIAYDGDKLVINGDIFLNRIEIRLSKTKNPNSQLSSNPINNLRINNGNVYFVDSLDNVKQPLKHIGGGVYEYIGNLSLDNHYKIVAEVEGYPSAHSSWISIPKKGIYSNIRAVYTANETEKPSINLSFTIQDSKPNIKEYFIVKTEIIRKTSRVNTFEDFDIGERINISCEFKRVIIPIFSDICFDGNTLDIQLKITEKDIQPTDLLSVEIAAVNELYFTYSNYLDNPTNAIQSAFTQPVIIPSNIINGFGIVMGYYTSNYLLELN